jgi:hypothetical protein
VRVCVCVGRVENMWLLCDRTTQGMPAVGGRGGAEREIGTYSANSPVQYPNPMEKYFQSQ